MHYKGRGEHSVNNLESMVEAITEENAKIKAELEGAEKVIKYYGDKNSWIPFCDCGDGTIRVDIEEKDHEDLGPIYGGKSARAWLAERKKK